MSRCVNRQEIAVTVDAAGAGTVLSSRPISGKIVEVRMDDAGTALTGTGGTADFTLTRNRDGGTILSAANQSAPWQYQPRAAAHSTSAGTTAYALGVGPVYGDGIPCDDHIKLLVASGQPSASGTVFVHYEA